MILAYLDSLFILYSFLPQPLPCNNILTISLRQKEQQQQESRKRKLDPKWELSILNLQNLFRPFLFILWMCDYLLFLNNLNVSFKFCSWPSQTFLHKSLHLDNRNVLFFFFYFSKLKLFFRNSEFLPGKVQHIYNDNFSSLMC